MLKLSIWILLITKVMVGFSSNYYGGASSVSLNSNGNHLITTHNNRLAVLWNLKTKTSQVVGRDANIYSAYFIKQSNKYLWQDIQNNLVYIQSTEPRLVKTFHPGFATYGHIMTPDLKKYVSANEELSLFEFIGNTKYIIRKGFNNFKGYGKRLNLILIDDTFVSSGLCGQKGQSLPITSALTGKEYFKWKHDYDYSLYPCITLYDIKKHWAIKKFTGNAAKTTAIISPDGRYLVSGDENMASYVWDLQTDKKLYKLTYLFKHEQHPDCVWYGGPACEPKKIDMIKPPKDFCKKDSHGKCTWDFPAINAIKFVSNQHFLRFTPGIDYAILYVIGNPKPLKYFKLSPHARHYDYNNVAEEIDTAPETGILALSAATHCGVLIYQFDKEKLSLKLLWESKGPKELQTTPT